MNQGNNSTRDKENDGAGVGTTTASGQFLWLSDIHLDPYYGTESAAGHANCFLPSSPLYGQLGCDTPERLIRRVLDHAAAVMPTPDFVVVTGDMCRHNTEHLNDPERETRAILRNVTDILRSTWGRNISIIPSVGNNDVTPDYYLDVQHPVQVLEMVANGLQDVLESETESSTFRWGGYFARNVTDHVTVLSLNTILYSTAHNPDTSHLPDPLDQFVWLQRQLTIAQGANRKVYIVGHIPPALGSYRHTQLWYESYARQYYAILDLHDKVIKGQFFGHLHSDEFRIIRMSNERSSGGDMGIQRIPKPWPLWLAPSITPIYGSNPSFRAVSYDSVSGDLLDYHTYYLKLFDDNSDDISNENKTATTLSPPWATGLSFKESFGLPDLSIVSLQGLVLKLNQSVLHGENVTDSNALWQALLARQHVHVEDGKRSCMDSDCRREWICTLTTFTEHDFENCTAFSVRRDTTWSIFPWERVVGIVAGGICTVCWLWWLQKYLRRRHYQQHIDVPVHTDEELNGPFSKQLGSPERMISHDDSIEFNGRREEDQHRPRLLRAIS